MQHNDIHTYTHRGREVDPIKQNEIIISIKVAPPKLKLHGKLCKIGMHIELNEKSNRIEWDKNESERERQWNRKRVEKKMQEERRCMKSIHKYWYILIGSRMRAANVGGQPNGKEWQERKKTTYKVKNEIEKEQNQFN